MAQDTTGFFEKVNKEMYGRRTDGTSEWTQQQKVKQTTRCIDPERAEGQRESAKRGVARSGGVHKNWSGKQK